MFGSIFTLLKWGAGVGVLVTPIAYIAGSSNSWETKWFRKISFPNLVLDCKVDGVSVGGGTDTQSERYEIFLTLKGEKGGLTGEDISFKILKSVGNKFGSKVSWGPKYDVSQSLVGWRLRSNASKEIDFQYSATGTDFQENNYRTAKCQDTKNILSSLSNTGGEKIVKGEEIKFTLPQRDSCKKTNFVNVECDISINSSNNLKWEDGFKPKVIFSPL